MTGESPYHRLSESETNMELDSSLYSDAPGGIKPVYEDGMPSSGEKLGYEPTAVFVPNIQKEIVVNNSDMCLLYEQESMLGGASIGEAMMMRGSLYDQETMLGGSNAGMMGGSLLQELQDDNMEHTEEQFIELELDPDDGNNSHGLMETSAPENTKVYTDLAISKAWDAMLQSRLREQDDESRDSGIYSSSFHSNPSNSSVTMSKRTLQASFAEEDDCSSLSWTQKHPEGWTSKEVLDWIYYLAEAPNTPLDTAKLKGEAFACIDGKTLCGWTREDFRLADAQHGSHLYEYFQQLIGDQDFHAPEEVTENTGYEHQPCVNPLIEDIENRSSPLRTNVDPLLPNSSNTEHTLARSTLSRQTIGPVNVHINGQNYPLDLHDRFDDIASFALPSKNVHTSLNHCSGGMVRQMTPSNTTQLRHTIVTNQSNTSTSTSSLVSHKKLPVPKKRGRPRKVSQPEDFESGSDGAYKPCRRKQKPAVKDANRGGPRGKRDHSNKMLHLWEFLRDMLLNPECDHLIRWENRREGVFRVLKSNEVARLWGEKKKNQDMTYEKFSRSIRFCRTAGYFGEVPKNGHYPKKLVFAFGDRAHGWQPNSIINKCYV